MISQPLVYCPEQASIDPQNGLFPILEQLFSVRFGSSEQDRYNSVGELLTGVQLPTGNGRGVCSLKLPPHHCASEVGKSIEVRFADDSCVPFPFRNRRFTMKVSVLPEALAMKPGAIPLATCEVGPIWAYSHARGVRHFSSSLRLPILPTGGALQDVLGDNCFLQMLPLIQWLRAISGGDAYNDPPLRVCFIFDDPNLHWPSYGFVDYRRLARSTALGNYHVSFATIPLDTWYTHVATAEIFRSNSRYLSLAVHGNDHTKRELGRAYSESERVFLLRQAIRRVEQFERRTGLAVSRIMVPPHGACSEEMLASLPICGFEAACISHGSLRAHNKTQAWTQNLGYLPSEFVQGCPVFPRSGLSGDVTNRVLKAAFFGQPIILRGHHQDLRNGIELLDQHAGFINGLGKVLWTDLTTLARNSYQWRLDGMVCRVKPFARKVKFPVPESASSLVIESAAPDLPSDWKIVMANGNVANVCVGKSVALPDSKCESVIIEAITKTAICRSSGTNRPSARALVRRLMTEGRDRLLR